MNQNQTEPKPPSVEEPREEGLDETPCSASWIPATTKPTGWERKVLVWVVWPQCGWPQWPEPLIGWWKHGPGCFAVGNVENANHLVTHWMDISEPNSLVYKTADGSVERSVASLQPCQRTVFDCDTGVL